MLGQGVVCEFVSACAHAICCITSLAPIGGKASTATKATTTNLFFCRSYRRVMSLTNHIGNHSHKTYLLPLHWRNHIISILKGQKTGRSFDYRPEVSHPRRGLLRLRLFGLAALFAGGSPRAHSAASKVAFFWGRLRCGIQGFRGLRLLFSHPPS